MRLKFIFRPMENFDLIAQALDDKTTGSLAPRLRRGVAAYLHAANLPRAHDDIEDCCGALRARALECCAQYDSQRPLEGWLMRIAHNIVREAKYKNRNGETPVSQIGGNEEMRAQSQIEFWERMRASAAQQRVEDHRRRAELPMPTLEELLPSLSSGAQELLRLSIARGWDIERIAEHMGKSRGAVDTGLSRARAALFRSYRNWKRELEAFEDAPKTEGAALNARRAGGAFSR